MAAYPRWQCIVDLYCSECIVKYMDPISCRTISLDLSLQGNSTSIHTWLEFICCHLTCKNTLNTNEKISFSIPTIMLWIIGLSELQLQTLSEHALCLHVHVYEYYVTIAQTLCVYLFENQYTNVVSLMLEPIWLPVALSSSALFAASFLTYLSFY